MKYARTTSTARHTQKPGSVSVLYPDPGYPVPLWPWIPDLGSRTYIFEKEKTLYSQDKEAGRRMSSVEVFYIKLHIEARRLV